MKLPLLAFLVLCGVYAQAQVPYGNNPAAGHFLSTRGIRLYYEEYGQGEPVLLLHGNGGSINNMAGQIPFFSQHFKVIAVDTRAHGKSTDPSDSLSFEMIADDFSTLLDSLHLDSCNVIGWSDGGIDGLLLAIRHPDKVKRLAITGANLWPDTTGLTPFVFHLMVKEAAQLEKQTPTPQTRNALKIVNLDLYQPHITLQQLHTIHCPSLVIGGDHDVIPVLHTVLIAQNIPQSYCWIIPNSGHSTPVFKKDPFNKTILDFFTQPYRVITGVATFR
jgi:pimeloyl-ACP methyl ester carboxylesterase